MADTIITFCAHNDDQILGAGGTLAKYARQGYEVYTYIFSYGEQSHPWLKGEITAEMRIKEAHASDKVLGGKDIFFFGLKEGHFREEIQEKGIKEQMEAIIAEKQPKKIFTHSLDDPHPDHRVVYETVLEITQKIDCEVYSFNVWNLFNFKERDLPKLVVDISDTFSLKLDSFARHKSQKMTMISLLWKVYLQAIINGLRHHAKYAEVFYKIK
ncbi:PIG-L family deacetylase [Candidatus Woesearchaeota archaeon]|nr:PIG-L family deacetylase [Candidatus Woesearchaeota archaeon]